MTNNVVFFSGKLHIDKEKIDSSKVYFQLQKGRQCQCPDAERPEDDLPHAAPRLPVAALEHVVGRDLGRHRARGPRLVLVRELRLGDLHQQYSN